MQPTSVGIIGCGYISEEYLETFAQLDSLAVDACGDLDREAAAETAREHGIDSFGGVDAVLDHPNVEVVVNLTPPDQHAEVSETVLRADKHVFVEKPFAATTSAARRVLDLAAERDLLVGCAPDMFLGPAFQSCRAFVDAGKIGTVTGASIVRIGPGHESWHPNPEFYYREGGGPLFDFGPYYLTPLISFFGPVESVTGRTATPTTDRRVECGPREGERIEVTVPTDEVGTLSFATGVTASIRMSFEVQTSTLPSMPASTGHLFEVYGTDGTLAFANPSNPDDPVRYRHADEGEWDAVPVDREYAAGRGIGVVDLARAVRTDWDQRATGDLGYHVLDALESIRHSSDEGRHLEVASTVTKPEPVPGSFP